MLSHGQVTGEHPEAMRGPCVTLASKKMQLFASAKSIRILKKQGWKRTTEVTKHTSHCFFFQKEIVSRGGKTRTLCTVRFTDGPSQLRQSIFQIPTITS
jgi:hypothetical protein